MRILTERSQSGAARLGAKEYALKTSRLEDEGRVSFWPNFCEDKVIAIGWERIWEDCGLDPGKATPAEISAALVHLWPHPDENPDKRDTWPGRIAMKIKSFADLSAGYLVLICNGYPANAKAPVKIYGYARVNGPIQIIRAGTWPWLFKHPAAIQRVERDVSKQVVVEALRKRSLLETIHKLEQGAISRLAKAIGVPIQV